MARRIIALATAAMPPSRRDWGRAISAELEHASGPGGQMRLVLAAVRVALVPPRGCWRSWGAGSRSVLVAVIAYLPLGVGLYVSNVIMRSGQDSAAEILPMYGYLMVTLAAAGALARRAAPRTLGALVVAGVAAGVVLAVLFMATLAWLDNAFFSVISQQQEQLDNFRVSGMTSMRAYLNSNLESAILGVTLMFAAMGAVFAPIGAAIGAQLSALAGNPWSFVQVAADRHWWPGPRRRPSGPVARPRRGSRRGA